MLLLIAFVVGVIAAFAFVAFAPPAICNKPVLWLMDGQAWLADKFAD